MHHEKTYAISSRHMKCYAGPSLWVIMTTCHDGCQNFCKSGTVNSRWHVTTADDSQHPSQRISM